MLTKKLATYKDTTMYIFGFVAFLFIAMELAEESSAHQVTNYSTIKIKCVVLLTTSMKKFHCYMHVMIKKNMPQLHAINRALLSYTDYSVYKLAVQKQWGCTLIRLANHAC